MKIKAIVWMGLDHSVGFRDQLLLSSQGKLLEGVGYEQQEVPSVWTGKIEELNDSGELYIDQGTGYLNLPMGTIVSVHTFGVLGENVSQVLVAELEIS